MTHPNPLRPPRLLPAYLLGLLSRSIKLWRSLFFENPTGEGVALGVWLTYKELNDAVLRLSTEIHTHPYSELRPLVQDGQRRWGAVMTMVEDYVYCDKQWDEVLVLQNTRDDLDALRLLADLAGECVSANAWFLLGARLGEYQVSLTSDIVKPPSRAALDKLLDAAVALPHPEAAGIPALAALREHRPGETETPAAYLDRVLGAGAVPAGSRALGEDEKAMAGGAFAFDDYAVQSHLHSLEDAIRKGLARAPEAAGSPAGLTPTWDEDRSELRVGNVVVRAVRRRADNLIKVLGTFQDDGWPPRIDDPIGPKDPTRVTNVVAQLNEGLRLLRFGGDGTGEGFCWGWRRDRQIKPKKGGE